MLHRHPDLQKQHVASDSHRDIVVGVIQAHGPVLLAVNITFSLALPFSLLLL